MASQAEKNEKKWQEYIAKLAKVGLQPSEQMARAYQQQSGFWNTRDNEAANDFNRIVLGE